MEASAANVTRYDWRDEFDPARDLKPCPFCGGRAEERVSGSAGNRKWEIVCTACGCKTFKTVASPSHIRAWNRRA